jgi:type IV secretion system protein VirD4
VIAGDEAGCADGQDADNAGIRREPTLGEHEEIAPAPAPQEFDFEAPATSAEEMRRREFLRQAPLVARQAVLDPDDGLAL